METYSPEQLLTADFAEEEVTTSTAVPGSTSLDGEPTGSNSLGALLARMEMAIKASPPVPQPPTTSQNSSVSTAAEPSARAQILRDDPAGRDQVIDILDFCWKTLHLYGKRADDFKALIPMYMEFLGSYPAKDVEGAFRKYVRHRSEFPTPSDIIGIIEERVKRDGAYYTRLTRKAKDGAFLTDDELRYMRLYERQVQDDWG